MRLLVSPPSTLIVRVLPGQKQLDRVGPVVIEQGVAEHGGGRQVAHVQTDSDSAVEQFDCEVVTVSVIQQDSLALGSLEDESQIERSTGVERGPAVCRAAGPPVVLQSGTRTCTVHTVQYIQYSTYSTVHTVQYIQYSTYSTVHTVQYIQYSTYSTVHTVQYIQYSTYSTVHTVQYIQYSTYSTVHTVQYIQYSTYSTVHTVQYIQYSTYSTVHTVQYIQYSTYSTVQYSTVQYSTVQYSTVQYSTVQYSTV